MRNSTRKVATIAAAVVLGAGTTALHPLTASAAMPGDCSGFEAWESYHVTCQSGSGQFKASADCRSQASGEHVMRWASEWENVGEISVAQCPAGTTFLYGGWLLKG